MRENIAAKCKTLGKLLDIFVFILGTRYICYSFFKYIFY